MGVKFNPFTGNLDLIDTTAAAGSDTQVQFNSGGLLDGSADFTWDDTGKVLGVGGDIDLDDGGTYTTTLQTITPTAARTISFPDATGTVALVGGSSGQAIYNNAGALAGISTMTFDGTSVTLAGRLINSYTSLASSPAKIFTGTWFTGGTATTTKPHFLIEPTGATSTAWSTSGTGLGVNAASGFAGNLLDLQVNGTSIIRGSSTGFLNFTSLVGGFNGFRFQQAGVDRYTCAQNSAGDVVFSRFNASGVFQDDAFRIQATGFLCIGSSTNLFPGLKRSSTTLQVRLADDSAYTTIDAQLRAQGTAPASTGATGTAGDIRYDADYIYICTATNTWKRAALSTW